MIAKWSTRAPKKIFSNKLWSLNVILSALLRVVSLIFTTATPVLLLHLIRIPMLMIMIPFIVCAHRKFCNWWRVWLQLHNDCHCWELVESYAVMSSSVHLVPILDYEVNWFDSCCCWPVVNAQHDVTMATQNKASFIIAFYHSNFLHYL